MTAPISATRKLSVIICLTSRQRVAPSAPRMASSFARKAARPNCMFITFTHAISKTTTTAPSIAYTVWRSCGPVNVLSSGCTLAETSCPFVFGLSFANALRQPDEFCVHLIKAYSGFQPAHDRRSDTREIAARFGWKLIEKRNPKLFGDAET